MMSIHGRAPVIHIGSCSFRMLIALALLSSERPEIWRHGVGNNGPATDGRDGRNKRAGGFCVLLFQQSDIDTSLSHYAFSPQ